MSRAEPYYTSVISASFRPQESPVAMLRARLSRNPDQVQELERQLHEVSIIDSSKPKSRQEVLVGVVCGNKNQDEAA